MHRCDSTAKWRRSRKRAYRCLQLSRREFYGLGFGGARITLVTDNCVFCKIVRGEIAAEKVHEDDISIVFLDSAPIFAGHCLISPKEHFDTLMDLPPGLLEPLFSNAQLIARAVETGLGAEGSFVAVNNRIS